MEGQVGPGGRQGKFLERRGILSSFSVLFGCQNLDNVGSINVILFGKPSGRVLVSIVLRLGARFS
mgnify:CR=1 FL=1